MKRRKTLNVLLILFVSLVIYYSYGFVFSETADQGQLLLKSLWGASSLLIIGSFVSYSVFWRKKSHEKNNIQKDYQIVAIVPSFNEETHLLHQALESILNQTYPVKEIHVVDDGSEQPLIELKHPKIFYHYQSNQGKRYAQKKALDSLDQKAFNYILAVDSDSVLVPESVEKMVLAFEEDANLKACTGVVLTRNRCSNLITRVADLNIGITCLLGRPIRSLIGSLETTSGALALYDSKVVYKHLEEYVTTGTYSDDRQLCLYSLMYGNAIGISEAVVYSEMPEDFSSTCKQRLRWAKGSWKAIPFQLKHLNAKQLFFPIIGMLYLLTLPVFVLGLSLSVYHGFYQGALLYICIRLGIRYFQGFLYLSAHPKFTKREYLLYVSLIIPLEFVFNIVILIYLKYKALFHLKETDWLTRKGQCFD